MPSAEVLLEMQRKLAKKAQDLENYKDDPKKLLEKANEISKGAAELQKAALKFEAELTPQGGGGKEETVILTPDQRERLAESTGVAMEKLVVRDADGSFAKAMPTTQKPIIERLAARQAAALAMKKAKRDAIDKLLKHLKGMGVDALEPMIEAIEADPTLEKLKEYMEEFARQQKEAHPEAEQGGG